MSREEVKREEEEKRGWESSVNQCLSLSPEIAADLHQLLLGLSEKGLTGMRAYTAYRESCFYLFTSSRG